MSAPSQSPATASLTGRTVADVMHPGVVSCPPQSDLATLARTMAERQIHSVVVHGLARAAHGGEHLIWGVVADRDLVGAIARDVAATAGEIASTELVVVAPDDPLDEAVRLMAEHELSHLMVVGPDGSPVGVVSTLDIAGAVA